jgi:DNA-binding beta-propeller fold protein YncE
VSGGPARRRIAIAGIVAALIAGLAVGIALAVKAPGGRIGPKNRIQPTGRKLNPVGKMTRLGNFPTGGALTVDGRYLWTLSTGRGRNDIRIVRVRPRGGKVVQRIPMPGLSGGIAMSRDGRRGYVSGVADSEHLDERVSSKVPGRQGDVIHVFKLNRRTGHARRAGLIEVPPPSNAPAIQDFPPSTRQESWPRDLAVSRNGKTLLAALNLADAAAIVDTKTRSVRYVGVGHYPYGAAITRDGKLGLVTSETEGSVYLIDLASGTVVKQIQVGSRLSHPESIAVDPRRQRAYVAVTNQDVIAVIDTKRLRVMRTLSVARPQGTGTFPTHLSVTADGCDLLSADSGEDAVAVIALSRRRSCDRGSTARRRRTRQFGVVGRVPVASYPTVAAATPGRGRLVWVAARGVGVGPNRHGPDPRSPKDSDDYINSFQYLPSIVRGSAGILAFPSDARLHRLTPRAARQIVPSNSEKPPRGTPLRPNGPIKHVFFIVKENRTYDQLLGDDPRGDGDPGLTLFGKRYTPNLHALARRFPLLDHVYANSEASIDGHYWTAAGAVSDYVVKNWPQNYAARGRPYDWGSYMVSAPPKGYIFERLLDAGIPFFNYGEALAGLSPLPDKDRNQAETNTALQVLLRSDIQLSGPLPGPCYDAQIAGFSGPPGANVYDVYDSSLPPGAKPGAHSRFECFKRHFETQLATNSVPAFNYMLVYQDHTEGVKPGRRTPDAYMAINDWALGQVVDEISHSKIWQSSLILVQEDDSQDGADHVDAHRMPALAISPYTRKGAVVHNRYDQLSILRTAELVIGLKPLNLAEALAVPMYDAFTRAPANSAPYDAIVPNIDMTAVNPNTARNRRASAGLPLNQPDLIPQRQLDAILWHYRHGWDSAPPPPGPNASGLDRHPIGDEEESESSSRDFARELRRLYRKFARARDG